MSDAISLSPREFDFLQHFQTLSRSYPPALAKAALETAILRGEARAKFPFAERLYLTRPALEQATSYPVARYRAKRYAPFARIIDLGCSIGGDTLAFSAFCETIGIERDPLRLAMANANAGACASVGILSHRAVFLLADLEAPLPLAARPDTALFFDPARRKAGRRIYSVRQYQPPLSLVERWLPEYQALGVKVSPGVNLDEIQAYDAEIEFISWDGELKEAVLWFGPLQSTPPEARFRATLLPGEHTLIAGTPGELPERLSRPRAWVYEPDPAILRAGLVRHLGLMLDAYQLDSEIAYLTADSRIDTPFARVWQVEDWLPFQLKRLRAYLRERAVGRVTVKKRGSPLQPEALIRDLRLDGPEGRVLFLTQMRGKPIVVIAYEPS
ncbi:MAG: class I SAM-dependent methyltransferase [Anaerolineales bacterium]